jgi:hypothetical protein
LGRYTHTTSFGISFFWGYREADVGYFMYGMYVPTLGGIFGVLINDFLFEREDFLGGVDSLRDINKLIY